MIPKPLTNFSWFDQECEDVIIAVTDKTTMTFNLEEFSELYKIISDTRDNLLKLPEISILYIPIILTASIIIEIT